MTSDQDHIQRRIEETVVILRDLGLPRGQQNERSALTLLALLDLRPDVPWSAASSPLRGITPMMEFFSREYRKTYAPNSRETVRRFSVHQFIQAGLVVQNPDRPDRPVNSPRAVYQIEVGALKLLRAYGTDDWQPDLGKYLQSVGTLKSRYEAERLMQRIPVVLPAGTRISLSPGGQNVLVQMIISEFCPRFTPGGHVLYVGDTDEKFSFIDNSRLNLLGISIEEHGKMPDVIVYLGDHECLVLIEAVNSHGHVNPKRHAELKQLFGGSSAGLVFVTAFLSRPAMNRYLSEIAWETEVWVADSPSHLIHFNGERFLGPYV